MLDSYTRDPLMQATGVGTQAGTTNRSDVSPVSPAKVSGADAGPSTIPVIDLTRPPNVRPSLVASALGEDWNAEKFRAKSTRDGQHSASSIEKRKQNLSRAFAVGALAAVIAIFYELGRPWENDLEKRKIAGDAESADAQGLSGFFARAGARAKDQLDFFNKPPWEPLLPPPLPEPHQRAYTLCIDLDDLLVHSEWDRVHGWRTAKRPGLDYFLSYLAQFYEIVVFTSQPSYTALPIIEKIDPLNYTITYKLFRDCTRWVKGDLVKDLNYLGRDLSRVMMLDTTPQAFKLHPHNGVLVSRWTGEKNDLALIRMIPFLEAVAIQNVQDVRSVLKKYADEGRTADVSAAFAEEQAKFKRKWIADWEAGEEQRRKSIVSGGLRKWLGVGDPASPVSNTGPPLTLLERERDRAQKHYAEESKYFRENADLIQKQMEDDRERQLKEYALLILGSTQAANLNRMPKQTDQ